MSLTEPAGSGPEGKGLRPGGSAQRVKKLSFNIPAVQISIPGWDWTWIRDEKTK